MYCSSNTTAQNTIHSHYASSDMPDAVGHRVEDLYAKVCKHVRII